jgi:hypothetical protein
VQCSAPYVHKVPKACKGSPSVLRLVAIGSQLAMKNVFCEFFCDDNCFFRQYGIARSAMDNNFEVRRNSPKSISNISCCGHYRHFRAFFLSLLPSLWTKERGPQARPKQKRSPGPRLQPPQTQHEVLAVKVQSQTVLLSMPAPGSRSRTAINVRRVFVLPGEAPPRRSLSWAAPAALAVACLCNLSQRKQKKTKSGSGVPQTAALCI